MAGKHKRITEREILESAAELVEVLKRHTSNGKVAIEVLDTAKAAVWGSIRPDPSA
jgi:hypothetical protein